MHRVLAVVLLLSTVLLGACQSIQPNTGETPATAAADALVGVDWQLTLLRNEPVLTDVAVTALFGDDNTLSGSGGCNNYNTTYRTADTAMTIDSQITSTRMACDPQVMAQEEALFRAYADVVEFRIDRDRLDLLGENKVGLLQFKAPAP